MSTDYSIGKVNHAVSEFKKMQKLERKLDKVKDTISILIKTMSEQEFQDYLEETEKLEKSLENV